MRWFRLLAVAVLALVVAACLVGGVSGQNEGYISASKVAPSGGDTHFEIVIGAYWGSNQYLVADGEETDPPTIPGPDYLGEHYIEEDLSSVYYWTGEGWEEVPNPGWVLQSISCQITSDSSTPSTYQVDLANSRVIIQYNDPDDIVECTFTNALAPTPTPGPVGGVLTPANTLALLSPWLAVIGLVGCIGTVVAVARKRRP